MEFEDEDRDEELEEEDDDEDDEETTTTTMTLLTPPPYHHHHNNNSSSNNNNNKLEFVKSTTAVSRYRECLKNHAVSIGGHAVDGCGEFMPAGPDGSLDGLKCAACGCHRNFHRKEQLQIPDTQQLTLYRPPPPPPPPHPPPQVYQFYPAGRPGFLQQAAAAAAAAAVSAPEEQVTGGMMAMTMSNTTSSSGKKRHRTKFSQEQKDKMLGFAEQLGWKIQKCDESEVQRFCDETGVRRHVLKVWMHNNKHTLGKKPV